MWKYDIRNKSFHRNLTPTIHAEVKPIHGKWKAKIFVDNLDENLDFLDESFSSSGEAKTYCTKTCNKFLQEYEDFI